jgi:transcriptional regulator with XRE-family HTH domain|nr:MAG TPA: Repressor protein CI [Caudoviricetes sp.]DAZ54115.1 MAG TPA: Repressor protein CI [Caudoviricetes sp.]
MAVNEVFCRRLRMLRERKHLKRRVLAELCGLSQHMIRRYEEGEMEPKSSSLEALSDYFGVTVDYLLGREEKNKKGT